MALSKPQLPETPQRSLEGETENYGRNCLFYCKGCHLQLCEHCREEHLKSADTKHHKVTILFEKSKCQLPVQKCHIHSTKDVDMLCEQCQVAVCSKCATQDHQGHTFIDLDVTMPFQKSKSQLPVKKCGIHSTKDVDMFCEQCQVALCSKCATQDHRGHTFNDLETVYNDKCVVCFNKLLKIQDKEKTALKKTLTLSSSVTMVRECSVPVADEVFHLTVGKSGILWVSDTRGNLVQTDLQGNLLKSIQTDGRAEGYHAVSADNDLIYLQKEKSVVNIITQDKKITELIKTGDWQPFSIHSSHINGDILIGTVRNGTEAQVTRYSKTGQKKQNISRDNKGREMYCYPIYITENINGDICTSDSGKRAVVVVNKSGQYRFSYTKESHNFKPHGICCDALGHIIVSIFNETVDILNQDGGFLRSLLTQENGVKYPSSVCVDDENNLYVGQRFTSTVMTFKYLQ